MFLNLNVEPLFPLQYTVSVNCLGPNSNFFSFHSSKQKTESGFSSIGISNRWSHAAPGRCFRLQTALLSLYHTAQQHQGLQMLPKSGDYTCWCSMCGEQSGSFKHIYRRGGCVYVEPPPVTATSDRRSLNADLLGIKQCAVRRAAGQQHEVSPRPECSFPSSQETIKLLLINKKRHHLLFLPSFSRDK